MRKRELGRSWRSGIRCGKASEGRLAPAVALILLVTACATEPAEVPADSGAAPAVVTTDGETLLGAIVAGDPAVAVFKGIPYAAPPVGELRWRPPAPISPREGVQAATEYGPACIQRPDDTPGWYRYIARVFGQDPALVPDLEPTSEDCLHLNVWTANLGGDEPWPVMVWIHGGGNTSGSPEERTYDGANLARKGVVVVSFKYRLGVFGFFAHPTLTAESEHDSSGNYALLDQIAALQWVQRNITALGGDPNRVAIFGESAGAANVAYLMSSALARGLFHRAISQSGGYAVSEFRTLDDAEAIGGGLAAALGVVESEDALAALRALSAEDLYRKALESNTEGLNTPVVDGWVLEEAPAEVFEAGHQASVPLLIGFNADEWTTLRRYSPDISLEAFHRELRRNYGELADRAMELYPATTDGEAVTTNDRWQTDWWFACPSRFIADRMGRALAPTYFYMFTRSLPGPGGEQLGASHGAENPYVFDNLELEAWVPHEDHDRQLAEIISGYWVRFAATGDPNGGDNPYWPSYSVESRAYLELGDQIAAGTGIRPDHCALFDEVLRQRILGDG